jgi:endonuclease YncB( thermonuclease family)
MGGADHLGQPIGKFPLRFLLLALLSIAGILGVVVLMQKGQERIAAEGALASGAAATAQQAGSDQASAADTSSSAGKAAGGTPPPAANATAETAASSPARSAAQPVDKPSAKAPPVPAAPAFQVIAKPAVVAAGVLETTRGRVTLKDITPLEAVTRCGEGASAWPCGQLAVTQLRRLLRGRSVNCEIPDPGWEGAVVARCMLGEQDVAAWLVQNGWARANLGSAYAGAGEAAEAAGRGMFGRDPRQP